MAKLSNPVKNIIALGRKLNRLRTKKEKLEAELKLINIEKEDLEVRQLPKLMDEYDIEKISIKNVGTLYTQAGVYAYIKAEDRDKGHNWFKKNGHQDLVKESVHHGTLKAWVKEQLDNGKKVPDWCNSKPTTTARIRRS